MEDVPTLFQRRLLIVSGKGGVGKSTVSAALGVLAARYGRKTLIVELAGQESMATLLEGKSVGYEIVERRPGLYSMSVTPEASMQDYLVRELHSKLLYQLTFKNRFVAPFVAAVPGLEDLISIGKVMDLERSVDKKGNPHWDLIVVDAPATGQGLNLLRVPKAMMDMTISGPFYRNTKLIYDLLADHSRTALSLVTLPEEMPVNETIETYRQLRNQLGLDVRYLFVNHLRKQPFSTLEQEALPGLVSRGPAPGAAYSRGVRAVLGSALEISRRAELERRYVARLEENIPLPTISLPALPIRNMGPAEVDSLADVLAEGLRSQSERLWSQSPGEAR